MNPSPSPSAYLASGLDADLPVIDAHHHIWDLHANLHPWLRDEPPPAFRYGDSRPLRRNYLPADYRRDAAGQQIVATVYMEAEHLRRAGARSRQPTLARLLDRTSKLVQDGVRKGALRKDDAQLYPTLLIGMVSLAKRGMRLPRKLNCRANF